ncbi:hypothetical protein os4_17920 [Comamonadaceae bacterium OS-4]|nr:hypothetical protein os4_17920 [Comamonadaceae bacterium OS-4]
MIEPDILTVGELATRWQQTPLQIIKHAQALKVPLYFAFEGLVFDVNDRWHRGSGDYEQAREIEVLSASITRGESHIRRSARADVSKWEDRLSSDDIRKLRTEIEADKHKRTALIESLEQRCIERNRCEYRGYLRAAPSTLWDIATAGAAQFPHKAFHPHSPIHVATLPDRSAQIWDGRMVALEPRPGCDRYKKDTLATDDLCAFMVEIKAIEAHQATKQNTAPERGTTKQASALLKQAEQWISKARQRAGEIIERQRAKDLYPSQLDIADEIAKEFRAAGILGAEGKPLSGEYIKRHALKGITSAVIKQLSTQTGQSKRSK